MSTNPFQQTPKKFDENKLVRRKYKPVPSTQIEIRDCSLKLSAKQLSQVLTGPMVIDFGQMTIFASATKSFGVINQSKQHVIVQVMTQTKDVKISPGAQVIPPLGTAGFDVIFCSEAIQTVQTTVYMSLNEIHRIKFVVMGDVIPTEVDISTQDVKFRFPELSLEQSLSETIKLKNKGNSIAEFAFQKLNADDMKQLNIIPSSDSPSHVMQPVTSVFQIEPMQGYLPPGGELSVQITYRPGNIHSCEDAYWIAIKGGQSRKIVKFSGIMEQSKVVCNEKKIDFGTIFVGQRKIKSISLSNVGENAAVFSIEPLSTLKIYPMKGRILVGSTQKLLLEFRPTNPETIQVDLMIDIRGGKRLKIPIVAEAQVPKVEMDSGTLNFGEVFVGSCSTCPIVLKNKSELIPAILYLDLSQHPDFHVATESGELVTDTTGDDQPITCDIPDGSNEEEDESNESCLYSSEGETEEGIRL